ncbi:hypothetical protein V5O48_015912 [Marasmius crinis-equi]|uniref:Uncharacterized protein n=1 Tax=Marasmius crinis-equi TaxID=585013 RepID=A0ABR3ET59_9AGAR
MARPKLYFTKAERREANRVKNRRFYDKHRSEVLDMRKLKRAEEHKVHEEKERNRRLKREAQKEKQKRKLMAKAATEQAKEDRLALVTATKKDFEQKLKHLKDVYARQTRPSPRQYLNRLCQDTLRWKEKTDLTVMKRSIHISPVTIDKECFQLMLSKYQLLGKEFFVLFTDSDGDSESQARSEKISEFEQGLTRMIEVLSWLEVESSTAGLDVELRDFNFNRIHSYPSTMSSEPPQESPSSPMGIASWENACRRAQEFKLMGPNGQPISPSSSSGCPPLMESEFSEDVSEAASRRWAELTTESAPRSSNSEAAKISRSHWDELVAGSASRVAMRQGEHYHGKAKEFVERQLDLDKKYYEARLHSLQRAVARELDDDPREYFERLFSEFLLWKKANRPPISPLEHPYHLFTSLFTTVSTMFTQITLTLGMSELSDEYYALRVLLLHLQGCTTELEMALHEEDALDEDTVGRYFELEDRYKMRRFKFMDERLKTYYEEAGI